MTQKFKRKLCTRFTCAIVGTWSNQRLCHNIFKLRNYVFQTTKLKDLDMFLSIFLVNVARNCRIFKDHSQTLLRGGGGGGADAKKEYRKNFSPPPLQTVKKFRPPLFAMKITGQPHRKACKLNFYWKICGIFFRPSPLTKVKDFKGPFSALAPLQVFVNGPLWISSILVTV